MAGWVRRGCSARSVELFGYDRNVLSPRQRSRAVPTAPPVCIVRDLRLDLFRGLALVLIFLDHIPSNAVSWVTLRNYGFSDAAEIFIFISGYANAYVYGPVVRWRGMIDATAWILSRAWQIYLAQI